MRSGKPVTGRATPRPRTVPTETFTVIHAGIDAGGVGSDGTGSSGSSESDLAATLRAWTSAAGPWEGRVVEVWGSAWRRLFSGCIVTAAVGGGPVLFTAVPNANEFVADLRACGVTVRYRLARQSAVDDAELRAVSQGCPVGYL